MRKIVLMFIVFLLAFSLPVWAEDIDAEIDQLASSLKAEYTLGDPMVIGELTIIPVVKTSVLSLDSDERSLFHLEIGGIRLEPVALLVLKDGALQLYHVGEPDIGIGEVFEVQPDLQPQTQELTEDDIQKLLDKGKESLKNKDLDQAREIFKDLIQYCPDLADAHALLGQTLGELAQLTPEINEKIQYGMEAFQEFARALEIEPDNPYALTARGYARLIVPPPLGGADVAIEDFTKAIEKNPEHVDAYFGLAEAYKKKGEIEKADEMYKKILEIDPENEQAQQELGIGE